VKVANTDRSIPILKMCYMYEFKSPYCGRCVEYFLKCEHHELDTIARVVSPSRLAGEIRAAEIKK
jgi:hypothetical protein